MSSLHLSKEEVIELTDREKPCAQKRQLDSLGYEYRTRTDGSFVVPRAQFMQNSEAPAPKRHKMNIKAFRNGKAA